MTNARLPLGRSVYWALVCGILVHLSFYGVAFLPEGPSLIYPEINLPSLGQDFHQVPRGAAAYMAGGTLDGSMEGTNSYLKDGIKNVYHPFFTLVFGLPFSFLPPHGALIVFSVAKLVLTLLLVSIFLKKTKDPEPVLLFTFLAFTPLFREIWNGQYHAVLNFFIFLYFLRLNTRDDLIGGALLAMSLLIKPLALIWVAPLAIAGKLRSVASGLALYAICSIPFVFTAHDYFFASLFERVVRPRAALFDQVYCLQPILRHFGLDSLVVPLKIAIPIGLVLLQKKYRMRLESCLLLWLAYYLFFSDWVFEYHYSSVFPVLMAFPWLNQMLASQQARALLFCFSLPSLFWFAVPLNLPIRDPRLVTSAVFARAFPLALLIACSFQQGRTNKLQVKNIERQAT